MGTQQHQAAMDIPAQIQNLKNQNLSFENEEEAKKILQRISYYRLIKPYGSSFKVKKTGRYRDGITFEKIYRVYEFDNQLRALLNPYLQDIEITLRCQIANYFSVKYGALGYLNKENFDGAVSYAELREKIDQALVQSKDSPIIKHFVYNYENGSVPLYAAVEVFTFGTLVKFYSAMKTEDRKAISNMYENVDEYYLGSWLDSIAYVRNLCSHFNRLYRRTLVKKPMLYRRQDGEVDNTKLFGVLCCMRYLCKESGEWLSFVSALRDLMDEYKDCIAPSDIGCLKDGWYDKLRDQEDTMISSILEQIGLRKR